MMTLRLEITPDLERRLRHAAYERGLGTDQCALQLLEEGLPKSSTPTAPLRADPLMAMAGADDFEPVSVDEVVYR